MIAYFGKSLHLDIYFSLEYDPLNSVTQLFNLSLTRGFFLLFSTDGNASNIEGSASLKDKCWQISFAWDHFSNKNNTILNGLLLKRLTIQRKTVGFLERKNCDHHRITSEAYLAISMYLRFELYFRQRMSMVYCLCSWRFFFKKKTLGEKILLKLGFPRTSRKKYQGGTSLHKQSKWAEDQPFFRQLNVLFSNK